MKVLSVLLLLLTTTVLSAQSLAEIAAKEKERREKIPPSKVLGNEDLAGAEGNVSVTGKKTEPEAIATVPAEPLPTANKKSDWPEVFASCRSRYDAAKKLRDEKQDLIVNGLPIGTDLQRIPCQRIMINEFTPGWIRYAIDCERLEEEVKAQEVEMQKIQDDCLNEARKRSIPPGEARLD
jgi:hypothetical protein